VFMTILSPACIRMNISIKRDVIFDDSAFPVIVSSFVLCECDVTADDYIDGCTECNACSLSLSVCVCVSVCMASSISEFIEWICLVV